MIESTGTRGTVRALLGGLRHVTVLGLQKKTDELTVSPAMITQLLAGDRVIIVASEDPLGRIRSASKANA